MKLVIVDARLLYLGSANWTGAGLGVRGDSRRNFEVGVVTEDAAMIDQAQALFDDVWRGKPCKRCGLRDVCESPLDLEAPISRASTG
jgi:phosphatidylserine/phosphatidylglycerophosphate/cardiolipin synthase-like enzyme